MKAGRFFALAATIFLFAGCGGDDGKEPNGGNNNGGGEKEIVVPNQTQLNQTVYADQTQGASGVSFTTTGAWSSLITETRGDMPDWISITPDRGDKAGNYTIDIKLGKNLSGADRKATITIVCGETRITITVEQKAKTEGGGDPVPEQKIVSKMTITDSDDDVSYAELSYDLQGRISNSKTYKDNELIYQMKMTYTENKITVVSTTYGENSRDFTEIFTLSNGRIISVREGDEDYDNTKYEYDANGYLSRYTEFYRMDSVDPDGNVTEGKVTASNISDYTWSNENISKIQMTYPESDNLLVYTYEYNDLLNNKANIDFTTLIMNNSPALILSHAGKRTKNFIKKEIVSEDKGNKKNGTTTYRYEVDATGCVTDIYSKHTPEGGSEEAEIHMFKIEYK